jgi:hypothetical protein
LPMTPPTGLIRPGEAPRAIGAIGARPIPPTGPARAAVPCVAGSPTPAAAVRAVGR